MKNIIIIILLLVIRTAHGQQVLIDRGVQVDGLWCFPLYQDTTTYMYLSSSARLSVSESNTPQFSFMRYVATKASSGGSTSAITDATGGGILNFLVQYETPEKLVTNAQKVLRERFKNEAIKVRGPIVFSKGRWTLISSVLTKDTTKTERKILSAGEAPVLEGSRIALTFDLKPADANLLMENFKMSTPDVSLVFELGFSGLSENYDAEIEIDWSEVRDSKAFEAGASVYFVSADLKLGFDKLIKNGAVKLKSNGSNAQMEGLIQVVYDKLLNLMFSPVRPETVPEGQQGSMLQAITGMFGPGGILGSRSLTGFGANVGFQLKEMHSEGKSKLNFKGRTEKNLNHFIVFNIGDLYQQYGTNSKLFATRNIDDDAFRQREVYVGVDGELEKEFAKMINSVSIVLNKDHQNGQNTLQNFILNRESFKVLKNTAPLIYGFKADTNRVEWLNYNYKTIWQFQGGGTLETDWNSSAAAMINLYTPFQHRSIILDGNLKSLSDKGIRAVSVQIDYSFFGQRKQMRQTIRPTDDLAGKQFEVTLPNNTEEVDYTITWFDKNGQQKTLKGKDKFGLIFIDEIPE